MSLGSIVRGIAGPFERKLCAAYRSFFVDVARCTESISVAIPASARVIDVGGGDGEVINLLLSLRPDITVSMLDLRERIGIFLQPEFRTRVTLHPATSLASYLSRSGQGADALLVSDVVHHVPIDERAQFIRDCVALLNPGGVLIVKEVAPGGVVSLLSVLADRYITGDRHVSLLDKAELTKLVESHGLRRLSTLLHEREHPNYALSFICPREPAAA